MENDFKDITVQQGINNVIHYGNKDGDASKKEDIQKISSFHVTENQEERRKKNESYQIWRSIICNNLSLILSHSVLLTLMNSVTSLLPEDNLGTLSLTSASVTQFLSSAFFLTFLNKIFGMKRMLLIAKIILVIYTSSFLYRKESFIIPVSLGMGFAFSICFANSFAYGNALGYWYHKVNGGRLETILSFLSGIANGCIGGDFLYGNIIYYEVLKPGVEESANVTEFGICGASYCNEDLGNSSIVNSLPSSKVQNLIYIFLGIMGSSVLFQLFIVDINKSSEIKANSFLTILKDSYLLFLNPRGYLLIFVSLFCGMEEQFITAVFTDAYITCTSGAPDIGYVMFNFGAAQIIASFSEALIVKMIGRPAVILLSFTCFICVFTILLTIPASQFSLITLCIITFFYGAADSLMTTAACSLYGLLFPDDLEAAFSLSTLWDTSGALIANFINVYTCVYTKLYILFAIGTVGVTNFLILEYMIYKNYLKK